VAISNNVSAAEDFDVIAGVVTDTQFNPNGGIRIVNVRKRMDITLNMVTLTSEAILWFRLERVKPGSDSVGQQPQQLWQHPGFALRSEPPVFESV
jgi:hypothetical protein